VSPGRVVLIGFMGSGKTTVGRILAGRLGWDFIDTDALVESRAGARIAELWRSRGERAFRDMESGVIAELASRVKIVVATGGGAPAQTGNRDFFTDEETAVFRLRVTLASALKRTHHDSGRPLLAQEPGAIDALYDARQSLYDRLGIPVETEQMSPAEVAEQIITLLRDPTRSAPPGDSAS
jgi:shikimate kinase